VIAGRAAGAALSLSLAVLAACKAEEDRPPIPIAVPYPRSVDAGEILENVRAVIRYARLRDALDTVTLDDGQFGIRRALHVTSDLFPGGYVVVELEDPQRRPLAAMAMTEDGALMMLEDRRTGGVGPLDLGVAEAKVRARLEKPPLSVGYVYFHNPIEAGISFCRPLVLVRTEDGGIYLNSRGEAFADERGRMWRRAGGHASAPVAFASGLRLVPMGHW
jgi:hypothetical protein